MASSRELSTEEDYQDKTTEIGPPSSYEASLETGERTDLNQVLAESKHTVLPEEADISRRIYILGPGAVGLFIAHQLSTLTNPPPITLLVAKQRLLDRWNELGRRVSLTRHGVTEMRKNIDVNLIKHYATPVRKRTRPEHFIRQLIVSVKAHQVIEAIGSVKRYLTPDSTIAFTQNGQGFIEEVNEKLFPDVELRPRYLVATLSHGLYKDSEFKVTHRSVGTMTLSVQPTVTVEEWERHRTPEQWKKDAGRMWPESSRTLMRALTAAPMMKAAGVAPYELLSVVLMKLAGNAVINPLTALFNCKNGELLHNVAATRMMNMLLAEISLVFRSMPEARNVSDLEVALGPERLTAYVVSLTQKTAENESSMLQDMQAGKRTEIDYINGWIVRRGEQLGIKCIVNFAIQQLVNAKSVIAFNSREGLLPLELPRLRGLHELPPSFGEDRKRAGSKAQDASNLEAAKEIPEVQTSHNDDSSTSNISNNQEQVNNADRSSQ